MAGSSMFYHEQMLQQWFWAAYHPIGMESEKPITGVNEVYVAGIFGDIFDCIFATDSGNASGRFLSLELEYG